MDTEGRSVTLTNKSDGNFAIGSWAIKSVAADKEVIFKFNSRQVIKPGKTITVRSGMSICCSETESSFRCGPRTRVRPTRRRTASS